MSVMHRPFSSLICASLLALLVSMGAFSFPALAGKPGGGGTVTPPYLINSLGTAHTGGTQDLPRLNNANGGVLLVAGSSPSRPALWSVQATTGNVLDQATLPADGLARDVNDSGFAVGDFIEGGPFVDVPGIGTVPLSELGDWSNAMAVNNAGDIVGWYHTSAENPFGVLWHVDGLGNVTAPVDLGAFAPRDINDWGLMAGTKWVTPNFGVPAMAWFEAGQLIVEELPSLEGDANAVNNLGVIVGWASNGKSPRPTLWDTVSGTTTDLGDLGGGAGWALDINDQGEVVGYSSVRRSGYRAFLWKNGKMTNLSSTMGTDATLIEASGINNSGHIVGRMRTATGLSWFLLTPKP